jgi:hypothetical protein
MSAASYTEQRAERIAHRAGLRLTLSSSVAPTGAISPQRRGGGTHLPLMERVLRLVIVMRCNI